MGRPEKGSAQEQVHLARSAERRVFDLCHAFNEVMTGPNPLTKDEIRGLVEKRPELYSILRKWVA